MYPVSTCLQDGCEYIIPLYCGLLRPDRNLSDVSLRHRNCCRLVELTFETKSSVRIGETSTTKVVVGTVNSHPLMGNRDMIGRYKAAIDSTSILPPTPYSQTLFFFLPNTPVTARSSRLKSVQEAVKIYQQGRGKGEHHANSRQRRNDVSKLETRAQGLVPGNWGSSHL